MRFIAWLIGDLIWSFFCIGGAVWLVVAQHWSLWTLFLGVIFAAGYYKWKDVKE